MALPNIIQQINSKLPLSGGTLTGSIGINSGQTINFGRNNNITGCFVSYSQSSNGASEMAIHSCSTSDSPYTGACIYLHTDKDSRTSSRGEEAGAFCIAARKVIDGTNIDTSLSGYPNGDLYWGGYKVHTDNTYSGVSFLKCNETLSYGWNGLQYFNKTMSVSEDPTQNVSPTADWYHIIRMNHANGNGYYVDLAACFHNDRLYTRRVASGSCATGWNEIPVLVYSWKSGTQWYRKYSDGWIEQGGQTPRTADAYISISFPIAFAQDNPNVQLTRRFYYDNDSTASQNRTNSVSSVTKTGFKCYDNGWSGNGYGSAGVWHACGY